MPPSEQIPFEGVLNCWNDDHDLPDLLLSISRSGKTGRLQFSNPEGDKTLYIKDGKIVFAESSSQDDGLGQYLLRTGQISLMDYTRVSKLVQEGQRLATVLIAQKVLDQSELRPAIVGQVRSIVLGLFRRTETWYTFKESEPPPADSITLGIEVADVILEGVRFVESWRRVSKGAGSLDAVYRRAKEDEWTGLELDSGVQELLEMSREPVSLEEICTKAALPDFEACRYLWAFRSLGWIERVDAAELAAQQAAPEAPSAPPSPESLIETQVSVAPPTPPAKPAPTTIPERLIATQVAMDRPVMTPPPPAERPKAVPASAAQTQLAIEPTPQTASAPHPAHTQLAIEPPPEPVAQSPESLDPAHTQLAIEPPTEAIPEPSKPSTGPAHPAQTQMAIEPPQAPAPQSPAPPSTGELMESILDGDASGPTTPAPPPEAPSPPVDQGATQLFDAPSALPPEAPPPESPSAAPSGFEALMDDGPGAPSLRPSSPADTPTLPSVQPPVDPDEGQMASFGDVSMPDVSAADEVIETTPPSEPFVPMEPPPTPTLEAQVLTADAMEEPLPTAEELLPPSSSRTAKHGGVDLEEKFRHVLDDK